MALVCEILSCSKNEILSPKVRAEEQWSHWHSLSQVRRWETSRFPQLYFFMAQTSKVCQILLALWSGLRCLGVKTVSISHDHNVICPVDTAGVCPWIISVSTGKVWAFFRDTAGKRVKISPCLVWFCWTTVPPITGDRICSSTTLPRRQDRKKESSRTLHSREQLRERLCTSPALLCCCWPRRCCSLTAWQLHPDFNRGQQVCQS